MNISIIKILLVLFLFSQLVGCVSSSRIYISKSIVYNSYNSELKLQNGNCTILGTITDINTHKPIIAANVIIISTGIGIACDINGAYKISNIIPGTYDIRGSMVGYKPSVVLNAELRSNQTIKIDYELAQDTSGTVTIY
jgi:hypothetical protein